MLNQSLQEESRGVYIKPVPSSSAKNRRTTKLLVEMSIGVIGLIGIMLAQIADNQITRDPQKAQGHQTYKMSSVGNKLSDKVGSVGHVTPAVSQITLANILF